MSCDKSSWPMSSSTSSKLSERTVISGHGNASSDGSGLVVAVLYDDSLR